MTYGDWLNLFNNVFEGIRFSNRERVTLEVLNQNYRMKDLIFKFKMGDFNSQYKILEKIGEGSFSDVLKCVNKKTGVKYAAKCLKKSFSSKNQVTNCAEIIATKKLSRHPNVLYMFEYYYNESSMQTIFVFELMDLNIYEHMKKHKSPFSENLVQFYLYQILNGLDHLHKNGLFHRDVKPENILLKLGANMNKTSSNLSLNSSNFGDVIKLADLGSIRGMYSKRPYTEYISTRWYRSPECLLTNGYYGPKMDVWAAGCVFYEMITFTPLFPGSNEIDQLNRIHSILGTPPSNVFAKFNKHKSRNFVRFTPKPGLHLDTMNMSLSSEGREVLKLMLKYDPVSRSTVKRILEQDYFKILRENDLENKYEAEYAEVCTKNARNVGGDCKELNSMFQNEPLSFSNVYSGDKRSSQATIRSNFSKKIKKTPAKKEKRSDFSRLPTKEKLLECWGFNQDEGVKRKRSRDSDRIPTKRKYSECGSACKTSGSCNRVEKKCIARMKHELEKNSFVLPHQILGLSNSVTITDMQANVITLNSCRIKTLTSCCKKKL